MSQPQPRRAASLIVSLVVLAAVLRAPAAAAQEAAPAPPPKTWTDQAELGVVMTSGNSESSTFSFKNVLEGKWEKSKFLFKVAGLKADSTDETRFAVGSGTDFDVRSISHSETTAEAYELLSRYERLITKRHGWFAEASWQRNEFAGFENRYSIAAGLASTWKDGERLFYRTDVGLSWTSQDDVVEKLDVSDSWLGLRIGSLFKAKFGKGAEYVNEVIVDQNLDATEDLRVDMTNSIGVSLTDRLGLKVSHRLLYDGDPQLESIGLFDPADLTTPIGTVTTELDDVDMTLTAALVLTF